METLEGQCQVLGEKDPAAVSSPRVIARRAIGWRGSAGYRTGRRRGHAGGGAESAITPLAIVGFNSSRVLSTRNDSAENASRPLDKDRDGHVMGEGGAVLVLEALEHALQRGAPICAEVKGYAIANDAFHVTAPGPSASRAIHCMSKAHSDAGLAPPEIDYVNAHATSTDVNDRLETMALKDVFGGANCQGGH